MSVFRRTRTPAAVGESARTRRVLSIVGSAAAVFIVVGILFALTPAGDGALEPATAGDGAPGPGIVTSGGSGASWPQTLATRLEALPVGEHVREISVHPQGWTTLTTVLAAAEESRAAELCEAVRSIEEQLERGTGRRVFVADRRGSAMLAC